MRTAKYPDMNSHPTLLGLRKLAQVTLALGHSAACTSDPQLLRKGNHEGTCRRRLGGIAGCSQLKVMIFNPHKQYPCQENQKNLPSVNSFTLVAYTIETPSLSNELENDFFLMRHVQPVLSTL